MTKASQVKPAKIIFLDIDGPMIPYRAMFLPGQTRVMTVFDPIAVSFINNLCKEHGWKVVLHSSWIRIMGGEYTLNHCINQGIKAEHFHADAYCDENINWRYTRVAKWLKDHPEVTEYAIVDDEPYQDDIEYSSVAYPDGMSLHMVLVHYYNGFLFSTYNDILAQGKSEAPDAPHPRYHIEDDD